MTETTTVLDHLKSELADQTAKLEELTELHRPTLEAAQLATDAITAQRRYTKRLKEAIDLLDEGESRGQG